MQLYGHSWWSISWFYVTDVEIGNGFALNNAILFENYVFKL